MGLLQPSETRTTRAYKGHASTFSAGERDDIAWSYSEPEREMDRSATGSPSTTSSWTSSWTASRRSGPPVPSPGGLARTGNAHCG